MKFLKYILMPAAAFGLLAGCGELEKVTAPDPATAKAPVLTTAPASVVVTAENLKTESATFQWTPTDYGFPAAPTYSIMMSVAGGEPVELTAAQGSQASVLYELINTRAIAAGAEPDVETDVVFTLVSVLTPGFGGTLTSAPKSSKVTTYVPPPSTRWLWIAGTLPAPLPQWAPGDPNAPRLTSHSALEDFEGMVDLDSEGLQFKFCGQPDWSPDNWGGSKNAFVAGGDNITDLARGYYRLVVDAAITRIFSELKIETIGAIGNGVPGEWGSETKMTYDRATNTWTIPSIPMTNGGAFKLRINDDWANALGGTLDAATFTGGDITVDVPTGNYKMILHAGEFPYRIELTTP